MTGTDTAFTARFAPQTIAGMVANQTSLANFVPSTSPINTGMLSDIGRANIYAPDLQDNFYARFMRAPLARGDSVMAARIGEVVSRAYDPAAPDTALFNAANPAMQSIVAKKNFSRQIAVEINDYILKQFAQTEEMIGDVAAAIMATSNACYRDDMWVASKAYFSGSVQAAQADQIHVMGTAPTDPGYADEMVETIWGFAENKFAYKSTKYNQAQFNTKSENIHIALKKDVEFPAFKKLYSETFNPEFIKIARFLSGNIYKIHIRILAVSEIKTVSVFIIIQRFIDFMKCIERNISNTFVQCDVFQCGADKSKTPYFGNTSRNFKTIE